MNVAFGVLGHYLIKLLSLGPQSLPICTISFGDRDKKFIDIFLVHTISSELGSQTTAKGKKTLFHRKTKLYSAPTKRVLVIGSGMLRSINTELGYNKKKYIEQKKLKKPLSPN
jgi:hypothetical protein